MKALAVHPDGRTEEVAEVTWATLRAAVGGFLETVPVDWPGKDLAILWADEEGLLKRLPPNPAASLIAGRPIVGPVVLTGWHLDPDNYADLPEWVVGILA